MPRYANGSVEKALYSDIKREVLWDKRSKIPETEKKERKNSKRSRAHRLDVALAMQRPEAVSDENMAQMIHQMACWWYQKHLPAGRFVSTVRELIG